MQTFLDGQFVPEEQAVVSVFDRSFLYGDGLFETMLVVRGTPFRWPQHFDRLQRGAAFLGIRLPFTEAELREHAAELVRRNEMPDALLRLTLSRGVGPRGYSPKGANRPLVVMTLHTPPNPPQPWKVITSSFRLPAADSIAQFKTCNKLPQVLARAEAESAGADEALMINTDGYVVEGATSNLFWIERGIVCTTPLPGGVLAGVTREAILEVCPSLDIPIRECNVTVNDLANADGVFLALSSFGLVEAISLNRAPLRKSDLPKRIQHAYSGLIAAEC